MWFLPCAVFFPLETPHSVVNSTVTQVVPLVEIHMKSVNSLPQSSLNGGTLDRFNGIHDDIAISHDPKPANRGLVKEMGSLISGKSRAGEARWFVHGIFLAILLVPFLGWWKRDPFQRFGDLQLGDRSRWINWFTYTWQIFGTPLYPNSPCRFSRVANSCNAPKVTVNLQRGT